MSTWIYISGIRNLRYKRLLIISFFYIIQDETAPFLYVLMFLAERLICATTSRNRLIFCWQFSCFRKFLWICFRVLINVSALQVCLITVGLLDMPGLYQSSALFKKKTINYSRSNVILIIRNGFLPPHYPSFDYLPAFFFFFPLSHFLAIHLDAWQPGEPWRGSLWLKPCKWTQLVQHHPAN